MSSSKNSNTDINSLIPYPVKFALGGCAGMSATCIVQPFDLMKSRLQVRGEGVKSSEGIVSIFKDIRKNEGLGALYNGLSAALVRQIFYTSTRMGVFDSLNNFYTSTTKERPNFLVKMAMGSTAGAIAAFVGNPTEVALIRMTTEKVKKNLFGTWSSIVADKGITGLWVGCIPTMYRAIAINCAQLATYAQFKEIIAEKLHITGFPNFLAASFTSGLISSIVSLPIDMAKTRLQKDSKQLYKGSTDVIVNVVKKEGFFSLWKGFLPFYIKTGSHAVFCFLFLEKYRQIYCSANNLI